MIAQEIILSDVKAFYVQGHFSHRGRLFRHIACAEIRLQAEVTRHRSGQGDSDIYNKINKPDSVYLMHSKR